MWNIEKEKKSARNYDDHIKCVLLFVLVIFLPQFSF